MSKTADIAPEKAPKWFRSGVQRSAPSGKVIRAESVIEGVSVCSAGEAKGHGVHLDEEFLDDVVRLGNEKPRVGVKMRFGHPNMCSTALGTFLGRAKNFRRDGLTVKADAFISDTAKETPNGDLHSYVFDIAEKEPDMFGTSIVFTPGDHYKRDEKGVKYKYSWDAGAWVDADGNEKERGMLSLETFVEIEKLHADDFVDDPATNDGLFSQSSIASEITEHLDNNPEQLQSLLDNQELLESVFGRDETRQFVARYQEYSKTTNTKPVEDKEPMNPDEEQETPEETETPETGAETEEQAESTEEPGAESPATDEEPEPGAESPDEEQQQETDDIDRAEFNRAFDEFGPDIAGQAFRDGGGYEQARQGYIRHLESENEELKKAKPTGKPRGEKGGEFSEEPTNTKRKRFNTGR